jgi:hypothetical protein
VRHRLLRHWPRARRDTLCVLEQNVDRVLTSESPSTTHGSVVTANSGATETFHGRSNTAYKNWLQLVQPTAASHVYASFVEQKVAAHCDVVWTTGTVQCLHQGILSSMTRTLPANSILPNESILPKTDSICDLPLLLTYLDNHATKRHRTDATRSPATGGRARRASNGAAAPSSLPSSSPLPHHPLPPSNAPAPTAGILAGIHSRPGDLVDLLTRSGSFAFLSDLFDTGRLFELRDFRIPTVMPKGEAIEQFAASMHLVLDLADKYPLDSLAAHILDVVAQFLPALLMSCSRRGRVRQIVSNAKRFQRGEWKLCTL